MATRSPNVCASCRSRKQRCDKSLPSCSRCQSKLLRCDYTWFNPKLDTDHDRYIQNIDSKRMIVQHCAGCVDLTSHAAAALLQASSSEATDEHLASLTWSVLEEAGVTPLALSEEYSSLIYPWLPIIGHAKFCSQLTKWTEVRDPKFTMIIWALFLVTRRPCATMHHSMQTLLYRTAKQMYMLKASPALETLQAGLLIAYYSCGHGFSRDAHVILATCVTQARLMGMNFQDIVTGASADTELSACKWAIILIDRAVVLSAFREPVPLALPLNFNSTAACLALLQDSGDSCRSFDISSRVALVVGAALSYASDPNPAALAGYSYGKTKDDIEKLVQGLICSSKDGRGSYTYCESTTLAVTVHLALQIVNPHSEAIVPNSKEWLLLHSTLRMARQQLQSASHLMPGEHSVTMPVVPLCTMSRAAVITMQLYGVHLPAEELDQIRANLRRFGSRWNLARMYLDRINEIATGTTASMVEDYSTLTK